MDTSRYHPGRPVNIHNANLLGAWLVHVAGTAGAAGHVQRAIDRTLDAQRPDGSWPYGEASNLGWTDSFHSGYVLICLDRLRSVDPRIGEAVARGAAHYRTLLRRRVRRALASGRTSGFPRTPTLREPA